MAAKWKAPLALALLASALGAQDISGVWEGITKPGARELRIVIEFRKADSRGWQALLHSIDEGTDVMASDTATFKAPMVEANFNQMRATFDGKLSSDGQSISGIFTQGQSLPLDLHRPARGEEWQIDATAHSAQFITVDTGVRLEVLDWGGTGRPLVLLTGLGNSAHIFDKFAPKLASSYHVYGITRRGFGASSAPSSGYSADRLGDDVLAVIDALKLDRPVLAGHSIAGEELSSIGSRHPEKVAALIYLDAAFSYAFYNPPFMTQDIDIGELRRKLDRLQAGIGAQETKRLTNEILENDLPALEQDLRESRKQMEEQPPPPGAPVTSPVRQAILAGGQKYTHITGPVLAILAVPHTPPPGDSAEAKTAAASDLALTTSQANAFEKGVPSAHVVRLPKANHYVFISNEADVLREMNTFIGSLP